MRTSSIPSFSLNTRLHQRLNPDGREVCFIVVLPADNQLRHTKLEE
jgi:hypothetical protein